MVSNMASAVSSSISTMALVSDPVVGIVADASSSSESASAEMESCCSGMSVGTAAVDDVALNETWRCLLRGDGLATAAVRPPDRRVEATIERASTRKNPLDADPTACAAAIVVYLWSTRGARPLTYP
jgi:hypothetical protein